MPWHLRWFVLLILFRPVLDNLYFLKNISPLLSPLYWVGILTPLLSIWAYLKERNITKTVVDKRMTYWFVLIVASAMMIVFYDPLNLLSVEFFLKLTMPVYLWWIVRRIIRSKKDLKGIVVTYLYSTVPIAIILLYEVLINPISVQESRGFERIQGSFGDVVSYSIYLSFAFLSATYLFFINKKRFTFRRRLRLVVVVGAFCLVALFHIHHVASYVVFTAVLGMFLMYNFRTNIASSMVILMIIVSSVAFLGQDFISERFSKLVEKDVEVYQGKADTKYMLHGRVGRWQMMLEDFFNQNPVAVLFGYPYSFNYAYHMVGVGPHNDFLRILFFTGIIGLLLYLSILNLIYRRVASLNTYQKYLGSTLLLITVLYSISVVPTYYPNYLYFMLSVFAFFALPKNKQIEGIKA
tara:strand:+ start:62047 stop:63273 length:1227 start_codon:yes stop_codon:yes gene_type:complete